MNRKVIILSIFLLGFTLIISSVSLSSQIQYQFLKSSDKHEDISANADAWVYNGIKVPGAKLVGILRLGYTGGGERG